MILQQLSDGCSKKRNWDYFMGISGKKISVDPAATCTSRVGLQYWRDGCILPKKIFANAYETTTSCSNTTGIHELLFFFVIEKSTKHHAFKNVKMTSLPVYYKAQKLVWMDGFCSNSDLIMNLFRN